jgi:hypothetical protein
MAKNDYTPDSNMDITLVRPPRPIGSKPNPGRPIVEKPKPVKPIKPGKPEMPVKSKQPIDFGKVLSQQPISMGEGYRDEVNKVRPMGDGSAMNKQYRAQGGGRFI